MKTTTNTPTISTAYARYLLEQVCKNTYCSSNPRWAQAHRAANIALCGHKLHRAEKASIASFSEDWILVCPIGHEKVWEIFSHWVWKNT